MADAIVVKCDACGKQFKAPADMAGKKARCPCGQVINVPEASGEDLARKWYYAKDGERFGPVPQAEIAQLASKRELSSGDFVWTQGMGEWRPASDVEELAGLFGAGASPAQPKAEAVPGSQTVATSSRLQPITEQVAAASATTSRPQPAAPQAAPPTTPGARVQPAAEPAAAAKRTVTQEVRAPAPRPAAVETRTTRRMSSLPEGPVPTYFFVRVVSLVFLVLGLLLTGFGLALAVLGMIDKKPPRPEFLYAGGACVLSGVVVLCVSQLLSIARDIGIRTLQLKDILRQVVEILAGIAEGE